MLKGKKTKNKGGRPIIRHGAYSYMTKLTLPDNRAYLRPYLSGVREGLIHDLGPTEEDLTTAQKLIIDRIIGQVGVIRLIEEYCREQGIFQGALLQPVLAKNYGAFTNSLRLNLEAIGLERKKNEVFLTPDELADAIMEDKREAKAKEDAQKAEDRPPSTGVEPKNGETSGDGQGGSAPGKQGSIEEGGNKARPTQTSSQIQGSGGEDESD